MRFPSGAAIAIIGCALLPALAHAAMVTTWDLRHGQSGGNWEVRGGLGNPQATEDGIIIKAADDGTLERATGVTHGIDALRVTVAGGKAGTMYIIWHPRGVPAGTVVQLPVTLTGLKSPEVLEIPLDAYPDWDPYTDHIGLGFPKGTELTLQEIDLLGWNRVEKAVEGWRSFWTFGTELPFSVNFLWGPLLTFNPLGRAQLYQMQPPRAWSANRVFYTILIITLLVGFVLQWLHRHGLRSFRSPLLRSPVLLLLSAFAALWILFDARMGMETLSYNLHDYRTFLSQPMGQRQFRNYLNFYDALFQSLPTLQQDSHYAFLTITRTPFPGLMEYFAYPSLPLPDDADVRSARTWLIFKRDDLTVDTENRIINADGLILSGPGRIIQRFDDSSFLFQVTSPPPNP